jgi:hypothetical protein
MFWKRGNVDVDAAWKQQNREQHDNPLYRYINLDKGGRLVEVYVERGAEACEHLIATELEPFLYNAGKGRIVHKIDYLRWRNKVEAKMSVSQCFGFLEDLCWNGCLAWGVWEGCP